MASLSLVCTPVLPTAAAVQGFLFGSSAPSRQIGSASLSLTALQPRTLSKTASLWKPFLGRGFGGRAVSPCPGAGEMARRSTMGAAEAALETVVGEKGGSRAELPELMTEFMVDMKCEGCVKNVRGKLQPLEGVKTVDIDLTNQVVRVLASTPLRELSAALEKSGRKSRVIGQGSPAELSLTAAVAEFKGPVVHGVVRFAMVSQEGARVEAQLDGLTPGPHGWSVNTYGDMTGGAASTGEVYNPKGAAHGALESEHCKVGNLGNLVANEKGHAEYSALNTKVRVADLIGRAVVIYEGEDDFGLGSKPTSKENGGVGAGIAAAVIARSAGVGENYKSLCTCDGTVIWEATPNDYVKAQ